MTNQKGDSRILTIEISKETAEKLEWLSSRFNMAIQEVITFCIDSIYDLAMDIHTYRLKEKHSNQLGSGSYERATANKL